ncbi:hypothetical protein CYMTET_11687 [Cymbomonas tetramitiformis]|uniref:Uncharacterized protein n=1 Tax=Cymbomonas tetramitiformis TaxID=36881 RepID=A0AAE0LD83_9CHLO|nr:hypothetical protein CYMTET_11687 [Cymbomonas tetramitiformis]
MRDGGVRNSGLQTNCFGGSLPTEIGALTSLAILNLHTNLMTGTIPTELMKCTKLRTANLNVNQFAGSMPNTFPLLTALTYWCAFLYGLQSLSSIYLTN